jgi:hypothetical protein
MLIGVFLQVDHKGPILKVKLLKVVHQMQQMNLKVGSKCNIELDVDKDPKGEPKDEKILKVT